MKLKKRLENLERKSFYYDYITRKYVSDKNLFDEFDKIDSEFRISELEKRADKKKYLPATDYLNPCNLRFNVACCSAFLKFRQSSH